MIDRKAAAARIVAAYNATDDETRRLGAAWYPNARSLCIDMAGVHHGPSTACGVVAALSPRNAWAQNLAQAARVLAAKRQRKGCPAVHTTAMRAQAWRIAGGEHPLDVLNGPKVRAFYLNLSGDHGVVTVDVWATRVALGLTADVQPPALTGAAYGSIALAYMVAAVTLDVPPAFVQATCWIDIRGKGD